MRLWQRLKQQAPVADKLSETGKLKLSSLKRFVSLFLVGITLSMGLASCTQGAFRALGRNADVELTLVSFSVTRAAYDQIIPQFIAQWEQEHDQTVRINQSYGGSGAQARAVMDGLNADVVSLALALDIKKIEKAGLIQAGWQKEMPNDAIVTRSVAALVTRKGNPKGIQSWADLAKDEVQVITANPKTSGGARWNFLGVWGSSSETGGNDAQALEFASRVYNNAPILPRDAREASDVFFKQGQGDVLINYENELIFAARHGQDLPYIVPNVNISIDNPVAIVDRNVERHNNREVAEAFVNFLFTPEAQREFAKVGFRPVNSTVEQEFANQYPPVQTLYTVQDLGGWNQVQEQFFDDGAVFDQILANRR